MAQPDLVGEITGVNRFWIVINGNNEVVDGPFTVFSQTQNIGNSTGSSEDNDNNFHTYFRLSEDQFYDPNEDYFIGGKTINLLSPGETSGVLSENTRDLELVPNGVYYLLHVTDVTRDDPDGDVAESNESNNVSVFPYRIFVTRSNTSGVDPMTNPDVVGSIIIKSGPKVTRGANLLADFTFSNFGTASLFTNQANNSNFFNYAVFLSEDNTFDDNTDIRIGNINQLFNNLAPDASTTLTDQSYTVPNDVPVGNYYVMLVSDYDPSFTDNCQRNIDVTVNNGVSGDTGGRICEINEFNNAIFYSQQIEVEAADPDLVIQNLNLSTTNLCVANVFNISGQVYNQGDGNAGASTVRYYISPTQSPIGGILLGAASTDPLAPDQSDAFNTNVIVPANLAAGTYFVVASADDGGIVNESNENNNTSSIQVQVGVAPTANFIGNTTNICVGDTVSFTDGSTGNPTQWNWIMSFSQVEFVNGTSSSSQNPQIKFLQEGQYNISLIASNACGSNQRDRLNYINANASIQTSLALSPLNPSALPGEQISFTVSSDGGGSNPTYIWRKNGEIVGTNSTNYSSNDFIDGDEIQVEMQSSDPCATPQVVFSEIATTRIIIDTECPAEFAENSTNQVGTFLGQAQVDGVPATEEDCIAAFDLEGNVAGSAKITINGGLAYIVLNIYGDDPQTSIDEGVTNNEPFILKLYDASESRILEYPHTGAAFQFNGWESSNGAPMSSYNDPNTIYNFNSIPADRIILNPGWNLISTDLVPFDSSMNGILAGLIPGNVEFVTGFKDGAVFYDPDGLPFLNTLTEFNRGYGYWIRVAQRDTLLLFGTPIDPDYRNSWQAGWNLIAYIPQNSTTPELFFASEIASGNLQYVTGFKQGNIFYDPNGLPFLNSLDTLSNGYGYWLRLQSPSNQMAERNSNQLEMIPNPRFMAVRGRLNIEPFSDEDFVEIINSNNEVIAKMKVYPGGYLGFTSLYGDDPSTNMLEGLEENERIRFRYNDFVFSNNMTFHGNMEIAKIQLNLPLTNFSIYPNPAKDQFKLRFDLQDAGDVQIRLYNLFGQEVQRKLTVGLEEKIYEFAIDTQNLSTGLYQVAVLVNNRVLARKKLRLIR